MPVTTFRRQPKGRSVTLTDAGIWEVREVWQAAFDVELTDPLEFLGDPLLPSIGEQHPSQSLLRLKGVTNGVPPSDGSLKALNFNLLWTTSRLPDTQHDPDRYVDPDVATKSWGHRIITEPVAKAYVSDDDGATFSSDEVPIENTMHDKLIPGIERNRYLPVCRYSRNELSVPADILDLPGYVNNDAFTLDGVSIAIGQALVTAAPISSVKRFETYSFRTVDYEITLRPEGWDESLLNQGFFCHNITNGKVERCMIKNGEADDATDRPWVPSPEASILDENGIDLTQWVYAGNTEASFVPHYRKFRHLVRTSFTALGFT